jgi:hypothetical protein
LKPIVSFGDPPWLENPPQPLSRRTNEDLEAWTDDHVVDESVRNRVGVSMFCDRRHNAAQVMASRSAAREPMWVEPRKESQVSVYLTGCVSQPMIWPTTWESWYVSPRMTNAQERKLWMQDATGNYEFAIQNQDNLGRCQPVKGSPHWRLWVCGLRGTEEWK